MGGGEAVHHIPHTWVNSCKEAGFSKGCVWGEGEISHAKNWANSCIGVGLGVHSLNLGQFSKTHAFTLDTEFHNCWPQSTSKLVINPWRTNCNTM